jgi:phosphomannomutase
MIKRIKFGTDGWRAIIAREFTVENVAGVSLACAAWVNMKYKNPKVVVGFDTRFGGAMFAETVTKVLASKGIEVITCKNFVPTPAVSYAITALEAVFGIVITASHNPSDYNGYKLKGIHGGPLMEEDIRNIENLINPEKEIDLDQISLENLTEKGLVSFMDIEALYTDHLKRSFHLDLIAKSRFRFAFDPMFGSGQNIMKKILPGVKSINNNPDPLFNGTSPEPLARNLQDFMSFIAKGGIYDCGLAVDGDADRIALINSKGEYIDSHHVILLLIHYLAGYRQQTGKIITGFSSTVKIEKLAAHYNLEVERVRIGFKDISKHMLKEDVLVGGEESGGIGVKGHIPERDGIWMGLLIWQMMAESDKSLETLINEIYSITGAFAFERSDLHIDKELKIRVMEKCKRNSYKNFGSYKVKNIEDLDGYKYFFDDDTWLMLRASGTEPVLRTYAEAKTREEALQILEEARKVIMSC